MSPGMLAGLYVQHLKMAPDPGELEICTVGKPGSYASEGCVTLLERGVADM